MAAPIVLPAIVTPDNMASVINKIPKATAINLLAAKTMANDGKLVAGDFIETAERNAGTGIGGSTYELKDAGSAGARPDEDPTKSAIIHIGSAGLYMEAKFDNGIYLEHFGVNPVGDNKTKIEAALQYASDNNLGAVQMLSNVYKTSAFTIPPFTGIVGKDFNALNVQYLGIIPADDCGIPVIKALTNTPSIDPLVTDTFITFNASSNSSGLMNVAIDASDYDGDVMLVDGSGAEVRQNNFFFNVLVYKGTGTQLKITDQNNGSYIDRLFLRGGRNIESTVSQYGLDDESQDGKIGIMFAGFHSVMGIVDNSGNCRRDRVDVWGCASTDAAMKISGSAVYNNLQSNSNNGSALLIASAQGFSINEFTSVKNNRFAEDLGNPQTLLTEIELTGDSRGGSIGRAYFKGYDGGTITHCIYQADNIQTGIHIGSIEGKESYPELVSDGVEKYCTIGNMRHTATPHRSEKAIQINENVMFNVFASDAPVGWSTRNAGTSTLITTDLPHGYSTGARITAGAVGTSGIMLVLDGAKYAGMRIKLKAMARGVGASAPDNQRLVLFGATGNPFEVIQDNNTWGEYCVIGDVPTGVSTLQLRILASNNITDGLTLDVTGVTVEVY